MKSIKKLIRAIWVLIVILFNKYVLRRKPKQAVNEKGQSYAEVQMQNVRSIELLISYGLMEIDIMRPCVYISQTAYKAFFCDADGQEVQDKAAAFMGNVRFYVNFQRNYARGLVELRAEEDPEQADDGLSEKLTTLADEEWLPFLISVDDEGTAVYKSGRYRDGELDMALADPEKHPVEAAMERMDRIKRMVEHG